MGNIRAFQNFVEQMCKLYAFNLWTLTRESLPSVKHCLNNNSFAFMFQVPTCQKLHLWPYHKIHTSLFTIPKSNSINLLQITGILIEKTSHNKQKKFFSNKYTATVVKFRLWAPVLGRRAPPLPWPSQRIPKCLLNWKCTGIIQTTVTVLLNLGEVNSTWCQRVLL